MGIWVDVAQLVGGAAAVIAIIFGVLDRRRQEYGANVSNAAGVTAWRAYAEAVGDSKRIPGVVIENASNEVAIKVDVKVGLLTGEEGHDFASEPDDSTDGLRIAVLPSGTWFVPLDDDEWKAQIEVDDGNGARRVAIPESEKFGAKRTSYQLFPAAKIEEYAPAVHFLRFDLSAARWWRDARGILHEDATRRFWRPLRQPSPTKWDAQFNKSSRTERGEATGLADFSKFAWQGDARRRGKFEIINLIAAWWAEKENLHTVETFEQRFGEELRKAVPAQAAKYGAGELLTDTSATVRNDGNPKHLGIELDGKPYGIRWACGFKSVPQVGLTLHKPIIDHFVTQHGAPTTPAA